MIRPVTCISVVLAAASGLYLYHVKHRTQMLDRQIAQVQHQAVAARERTRLLRAEWALLNDPARLQQLSDQYLQLKPMLPQQFVQMANLASRLPAPVARPAPAPAPAGPQTDGVPVAAATSPAMAADATAPDMAGAATPDGAQPALVADSAAAVAAQLATTTVPPPPVSMPQDLASTGHPAPPIRADQPQPATRSVTVAHRTSPRPARVATQVADTSRTAPIGPPVRRHTTAPLIAEAVAAPRAARYVPTSAREMVAQRAAAPAASMVGSALGMGHATLAPPVPVSWPPRGH